jgi:hypothetical protein
LILMSGVVVSARKLSEQRSSLTNISKIGIRIFWIMYVSWQ